MSQLDAVRTLVVVPLVSETPTSCRRYSYEGRQAAPAWPAGVCSKL
jgi:hypothetical protein